MGIDRVQCPYDPCSLMCMCQPGGMVRTSMYRKLGTEPEQEGTTWQGTCCQGGVQLAVVPHGWKSPA
jgi:hypothetical protein